MREAQSRQPSPTHTACSSQLCEYKGWAECKPAHCECWLWGVKEEEELSPPETSSSPAPSCPHTAHGSPVLKRPSNQRTVTQSCHRQRVVRMRTLPPHVKCNRDTRKPYCWISEGGRVWRRKGVGRICTHASEAVATTEINVIRVKFLLLNEKRRAESGSE